MSQRGFCQDLDEGKLSFPVIHAFRTLGNDDVVLTDLLHMRDRKNCLSLNAKQLILSQIEECGSLDYTQSFLDGLLLDLVTWLRKFESETDQKNWILQSLLLQLEIKMDVKSTKKDSTFANVLRVWGGYREAAWRSELN
jgi:geranylgeranyl pyrophosphate synthase